MNRKMKLVATAALLAVMVVAGVALSTNAEARPHPPLLCGFTAIWACTLPNGNVVTIVGTQCDVAKFEANTGASCVPQ